MLLLDNMDQNEFSTVAPSEGKVRTKIPHGYIPICTGFSGQRADHIGEPEKESSEIECFSTKNKHYCLSRPFSDVFCLAPFAHEDLEPDSGFREILHRIYKMPEVSSKPVELPLDKGVSTGRMFPGSLPATEMERIHAP